MYYIEIKDNCIVGKLESNTNIKLMNFIKVTKGEYDNIQMPYFVKNDNVNIQEIIILQSLLPSYEEIQKAQNTIEILTLIQEVIQ